MEMLISVVTLTYTRFELLYNAIDSVLEQDYPNIEYIISDDGSPNFPEKEIKQYIKQKRKNNLKNFYILTHDENQGTVKNLNDAYRHASGEIIIPVSADDALRDSTVIRRIAEVYSERNCDALMVGRALYSENGSFIRNIPSKKEAKILSDLTNSYDQYQRFITGRFYGAFSGSTLSVKKSFIEQWGYFDEKYTLWEDGPFFAQYLWTNYLECAFHIIGLKYHDGGVSSGKKHPLLLRDDELFRRTDRIAHIDELHFIEKAILKYSLTRPSDNSLKSRLLAVVEHPIGFLSIKLYRFSLRKLSD